MNSKLIDDLNQALSNCLVMFVKVHNYHWHVKGVEFFLVHEKTETIYNDFAVLYDDLAERIIQLGGVPLVTIKDALQKATIKEDPKTSFTVKEVFEGLLSDLEAFHKHFHSLCSKGDCDSTTQAFLEEKLAKWEADIWMLKSAIH